MRFPVHMAFLALIACGGGTSEDSGPTATTGPSTGGTGTGNASTTLTSPIPAELAADPRILDCLNVGGELTPVFPGEGEENTWAAVRLRHGSEAGRFHPETVHYVLVSALLAIEGIDCVPGLAHQVMLWTQDAGDQLPVPGPDAINLDMPADPGIDTGRRIAIDLKPYGFEVSQDQSLYVAVQMTGSFTDGQGTVSCMQSCGLQPGQEYEPGWALWVSTNTAAPFGFFDLHELNFARNVGFGMTVEGTYR